MVWAILAIAILLQIILTIKFINIVWKTTTGGDVHRQSHEHFFLGRPWLYSSVIQFLAFLLGFVFANELFFASQYGTNSCFYNSGFSRYGAWKLPLPIPWWVSSISCNGNRFRTEDTSFTSDSSHDSMMRSQPFPNQQSDKQRTLLSLPRSKPGHIHLP